MKINELDCIYIGYNKTEDFRILVFGCDENEAYEVAEGYRKDMEMEGEFEIHELPKDIEDLKHINFDCDYVIAPVVETETN